MGHIQLQACRRWPPAEQPRGSRSVWKSGGEMSRRDGWDLLKFPMTACLAATLQHAGVVRQASRVRPAELTKFYIVS